MDKQPKPNPLLVLLAVGFIAWNTLGATPKPVGPSDLLPLFAAAGQPTAKADAHALASFCKAMSDYIIDDARESPPDLVAMYQADRLRQKTYRKYFRTVSLVDRYPKVVEMVATSLQAVTTDAQAKLDESGLRLKIAAAWSAIAESAANASDGL